MSIIMVVDDNKHILRMLNSRLTQLGYEVIIANSGMKALTLLKSKTVDLVLLDQMMPELDGVGTMEQIKKIFSSYPPVIMMTAHSSLHLAVTFMQAGGSDFVEKPLDFEVLDIKIQKTIVASKRLQKEINERKRVEEELRQQAKKLAQSNIELEQFAYAVSHDLQEPLRMITSYIQLLEKRYKGNIDSKADKFIYYVVDGASRMQTLINNLLELSRLNSRGQRFIPVDCELLLKQTLRNLQTAINKGGAKITHDPLPTVIADSTQLEQVFQNLISNAIKFCAEEKLHIHISAELKPSAADRKKGDEWLFSVQDNGIGIAPKHAERIFIIFKQLNSRNKYPGTGIGLAICHKVIKRHGGRIWVESELGKGAIFYFTIPATVATNEL